MNGYPRPLTRIHQIEISSQCNLRCKYCPHPKLERPKQDMEYSIFTRALEWAQYYDVIGSQPELSLTGLGEALLHPDVIEYCQLARAALPNARLLLATNGLLLTDHVGKALAEHNVEVFVSTHRPEKAGPAIEVAKRYNILGGVNHAFATSSIDWAGQVEWFTSAPSNLKCLYLRDGWGTVLQNGDMVTCCMDAHGKRIVGHVDDAIGSVVVEPFDLCKSCSLVIDPPEGETNAA